MSYRRCMSYRRASPRREEGNILLVSLMAIVLLMGLATAQFAVSQKNIAQSRFFNDRSELHNYAESGANLGVHEVTNGIGENPGFVGTETWLASRDDVGEDGTAASGDEGEGDGVPGPGEPNVAPSSVGPSSRGISMIVYSEDLGGDVTRVVSTAWDSDNSVRVERQVKNEPLVIPRVGAVWVDPAVALDFKGNKFTIDGRDYAPDGTLTGNPALYGLATDSSNNPGDNSADIVAQIPSGNYDQIQGLGGTTPSVGEVAPVDIDALANASIASASTLAPGTYSNLTLGDYSASDLQVVHVPGDLHLSGQGTGAGILVVDGMLKISGQFRWTGLVMVRGDITLTGGGAGVHVFGSVMATESINAIDTSDLTVAGNADVFYSSEALDFVEENVAQSSGSYESVYYSEG